MMQNLSRWRKKEFRKKKQKKQVDQSKQILDKEIKEVQGKIDHLMESSKVLDKKFVELVKDADNHSNQSLMIEEANALMRKSESVFTVWKAKANIGSAES